MDPVNSLVGSVLLGFGTILVYGAYKNKKVFGADGIIPQALTTGSLATEIPEAFPGFGSGGVLGAGGGKETGRAEKGSGTSSKLQFALSVIKQSDPGLGADIENRVNAASASSSRQDLMPLAQLLALADAKGLRDSVSVIRAYILELTDERI